MSYHKKKGHTWVALIDSDEYITYNPFVMDDGENEGAVEKSPTTPDKYKDEAYVQMMQNMRKQLPSFTVHQNLYVNRWQENLISNPNVLWIKPASILDFLINQSYSFEPCLLMPRLFFSAVEMTQKDNDTITSHWGGIDPFAGYDSRYNVSRFRTLRYVHHQRKNTWAHNLYGKVMIDVSRIDDSEFYYNQTTSELIKRLFLSPHRPLGWSRVNEPRHLLCQNPRIPFRASFLRVNHYLGSLEEYMSRPDVRRSPGVYEDKARVDKGANYEILPWLQVFLDEVGDDNTAQMLLQSAGLLES
jgi:hypothetical protein